MKAVILSKVADVYQALAKATEHDTRDWLVTNQVSDVMSASEAQRASVRWLLAEPALAAQVLDALPNVQWMQSTWAGVEILLAPSMRHDYTLTNVRGIFAPLMVEYLLTHMLAHERLLYAHRAAFERREWFPRDGGLLRGKTVLLLGLGSIGAEMVAVFNVLGMRVLGVASAPRVVAGVAEVTDLAGVPRLLAQADYVVNVLPNTPTTQDVVNAAFLKQMQRHAVLINVGRGQAVVDADLAEALHAGTIAGAVLDVFRTEPLPAAHPFWDAPNLVSTSHTAAPSVPESVFEVFRDNLNRFERGEELLHRVDFARGY